MDNLMRAILNNREMENIKKVSKENLTNEEQKEIQEYE